MTNLTKDYTCDTANDGCGKEFPNGSQAKVPNEVFLPMNIVKVLHEVLETYSEDLKNVSFWEADDGSLRGKYENLLWLNMCKPCFKIKNNIR